MSRAAGTGAAIAVAVALSASVALAVDNDDFADAEEIAVTPFVTVGSTEGATIQTREPTCSGFAPTGASVWYRYTPAALGMAAAELQGSTGDSYLGVYTGRRLAELTEVACSDDFPTFVPLVMDDGTVTWPAEAGVTYHIRVSHWFGQTGMFKLSVVDVGM